MAEQVTGPHPSGEHPTGDQGTYRVCDSLRLLTILRAPRCEWPGCGHQATGCDQDHDTAWPDGATCACNLGSLCRRHHRVKQLLWIKKRLPGNIVAWTDPTGRTWRNPSPRQTPAPWRNPQSEPSATGLARLTGESDALGLNLSPDALREQLWLDEHDGQPPEPLDPFAPGQILDDRPEMIRARELSTLHPDDPHRKASFWATGPTAGTDPWRYDQPWGPDLENPYSWA